MAIHYRFNAAAVVFLKKCAELIIKKIHQTQKVIPQPGLFKRILVADSTQWQIHPALARFFRGMGGAASKAACKLQVLIEPKTGNILLFDYLKATFPDQGYSKRLVKFLSPGDLILFDLGYYSVQVFKRIERAKAFFIIPVYYNVVVSLQTTAKHCSLATLLLQHKDNSFIDLNIIVGSTQSMPVRLIALKASHDKANKMRRKVREDYRRRGAQPSKERLQFCDWNVVITNLCSVLTPKDILQLYGSRWLIEIFFRDLKSLLKLDAVSTSKKYRFECQVLATFILATLLFYIHGYFNHKYLASLNIELSFSKFILRFCQMVPLLHQYLLAQSQQALLQALTLIKRILRNAWKFHQPSRVTPFELMQIPALQKLT